MLDDWCAHAANAGANVTGWLRRIGTIKAMLIRTWLFDDVAVVEASGRLGIENASSLGDAVREAIRMSDRGLVLNLVGVSRVDAAGLGELAGAFRIVRAAAGEMKIVVRSPAVRDLLARTHLLSLFPTYETEAAALASFVCATTASP